MSNVIKMLISKYTNLIIQDFQSIMKYYFLYLNHLNNSNVNLVGILT